MSKEDFDTFWCTQLPTNCAKSTTAPDTSILYWTLVRDETSNYPWTRREGTPRSPAMTSLARDLMTQIRVATRKQVVSVTVIQNHSPCYDSAMELIKAVELAREKKITLQCSITFVALYKIRRRSWTNRGLAAEALDVAVNESNDNALGLRLLQECGVRLQTFNPETWSFLYAFLGNGMPSGIPGRFLSPKYAKSEARLEEDRIMREDLKYATRGVLLTSSTTSSEAMPSMSLLITWRTPILDLGALTEFKITFKKVQLKNKDVEEKLWRVQTQVEREGRCVVVSGELTSYRICDVDRDAHYDVTVEAFLKGMSVGSGRKIFKTDDRAFIQALASPRPASNLCRSQSFGRSSVSVGRSTESVGRDSRNGVTPPVSRAGSRATLLKRSNSVRSQVTSKPP